MELPLRTSVRLAEVVGGAELPPLSSIAAQLVATLSKDQVDVVYLRDLIAQDPTLTTSMLRWANSPIYGAARKVHTLDAAISILGISRVRARAIASFITNAIEMPVDIDRQRFRSACMRYAHYAMCVAPLAKVDPNEAWLTAMMVRLGELVIGRVDRSTLVEVEATPHPTPERWQVERTRFGFDEGDVIAELAKGWFFPDAMVDALHKCSNPLAYLVFSPLGATVHLAMLLGDAETLDEQCFTALPADVLKELAIDLQRLQRHLATCPPPADQ